MDQPHLGLPSREYYLSPRSKGDMEAYHTYMTEVRLFNFMDLYIYMSLDLVAF